MQPEIEGLQKELAIAKKKVERERAARNEAEKLLEEKSRRLFDAKAELERIHIQEREMSARLKGVLNSMPIGVFTSERQGLIRGINDTAKTYFKVGNEEVIDRHISDFLPSFSDMQNFCVSDSAGLQGGPDLLARRTDGSEFPCEVVISRFASAEDEIIIWMVRDVSRRVETERRQKELEGELRQAHRLESLGTMAGGIAHELNTPIQFVSDNMRFLADGFGDISRAIEAYSAIVTPEDRTRIAKDCDLDFLVEEIPRAIAQSCEGLERVSEIVLAIKRFSHPSGDAKENNDFNQIVATTATVSKNQWKYVADLELKLDSALPLVKSNAGELNQVLINLIVNAAHAIEDRGDKTNKGKITITTTRVGNSIACSVADTGVGIPAKNRDKVFDLFFTTKEPGRGTGQGLSLVHNIVKDHGGRITIDSDVGRGTRVIFILPIDQTTSLCERAA